MRGRRRRQRGKDKVRVPLREKGDWRGFSKVLVKVVVLPEGVLRGRKEGKRIKVPEGTREWILEGTVWVLEVSHP